MLILIADENFNNDIVRGMLRRKPDNDILLVVECSERGEWEGQIIYIPLQ